jgi:hypothetical protein
MLWIFSSSSDRVSGGQDLTLNFLKCGIVFDFLKNNKDITCTCSTLTVEWGIKRKGKESCAADVCYPDDMNKELCSKQIAKGLFIHIFKLHSLFWNITQTPLLDRCFYIGGQRLLCVWISGFIFGNYVVTIVFRVITFDGFLVWFLG